MQAVILAAGEGCRLRPLTRNRPKAMIRVGNRPILGYVMDALLANGIREIVVVVGYRKEQVLTYLTEREPVTVVEQPRQLGTAHALSCARQHLSGKFLVVPGDNWIDAASIGKVMKVPNAMLVKEHAHPSNFGVVRIEDGAVTSIVEKPEQAPTHTVSTGVLSLTPEIFDHMTTTEIPDALSQMIESGIRIRAVEAEQWHDALVPWDLLPINALLLRGIASRKEGTIGRNVILKGGVQVGPGTVIHPQTTIYGPCVIGRECEIGPQTTLFGPLSIGDRVSIGPHTHVENALLFDDVEISGQCTIQNAVVGEGSVLANHVVTRTSETLQAVGDQYWKTAFGAILGDQVQAAPFTVFSGCIVGNDVTVEEGRTIRGSLPDGSVVK